MDVIPPAWCMKEPRRNLTLYGEQLVRRPAKHHEELPASSATVGEKIIAVRGR